MSEAVMGDYREREQTAVGQARNLAAMGPEGRMQAMLAKDLLDQIGVENAPAGLQSMAASAFPEHVGKAQEKAGEGFVDEFRQASPEYRDKPSEIRGMVDQKQRQGIASQEQDAVKVAELIAERNKGQWDIVRAELDRRFAAQKIDLESKAARR